ncbi:MAG: hypothetical protein GX275_14375 [Clostridiales bacterium]|nr:hypothetical protein [Clostridiales bacterium]
MNIEYISSLPNNFPEELLVRSKSLEKLGICALAWNWEDAIKVAESLSSNNYSILGGDVYKLSKDELVSTFDNRYINEDITKLWSENIMLSKNRTIEYIRQYHDKSGENFYYSFVFKSKK